MESETPIKDRTIALCMKVSGKAGSETQEEVFLALDAALHQSDIFQSAGYSDVVIQPAHVVYDADAGKWRFAKIEGAAVINVSAVPAQYSRARSNPGISVYEYDRARERERHATMKQLLMAVMFTIAIGVAPGFYLGIAIADSVSAKSTGKVIIIGGCAIISSLLMLGIPLFRNKAMSAGIQFAGIYWVEEQ